MINFTFYDTTPPAIVSQYKACSSARIVREWGTAQMTEDEVVRNFFKKGIEILDKSMASIFKKYPHLAS